jgi:hypothetical protein
VLRAGSRKLDLPWEFRSADWCTRSLLLLPAALLYSLFFVAFFFFLLSDLDPT